MRSNARRTLRDTAPAFDVLSAKTIAQDIPRSGEKSITLPNEMAEFVQARTTCDDCASDNNVLRDALRAPLERDYAVEARLRADRIGRECTLRPSRTRVVDG